MSFPIPISNSPIYQGAASIRPPGECLGCQKGTAYGACSAAVPAPAIAVSGVASCGSSAVVSGPAPLVGSSVFAPFPSTTIYGGGGAGYAQGIASAAAAGFGVATTGPTPQIPYKSVPLIQAPIGCGSTVSAGCVGGAAAAPGLPLGIGFGHSAFYGGRYAYNSPLYSNTLTALPYTVAKDGVYANPPLAFATSATAPPVTKTISFSTSLP
jgi:hypothetical protein